MNIRNHQNEVEQLAGTYHAQGGYGAYGVHDAHGSRKDSAVHETGSRGFCVDFSGGISGNQAYENHGKTIEDVMSEAAGTDVALQKDYMTVMASTMSDEDFAKLSEEGFDPGKMNPEEMVTIVDEIKAELAESGVVVTGYNDDMDSEMLEKITGSEVQAQAILDAFHQYDIPVTESNVEETQSAMEMAKQLTGISDGMKKYLLENHLPPTIENLYRAAYSGSSDAGMQGRGYFAEATSGYYGRKADQVDTAALLEPMKKVIQEAGYEVTEERLQDAEWMLQSGLTLTEESFAELEKINEVSLPVTDSEAAMAAARAIQDGRPTKAAEVGGRESMLEQAVRINKEASLISDKAIDKVIAKGDKPDLAHLTAAEKEIQSEETLQDENPDYIHNAETEELSDRAVVARRQMEEVRLIMSVQVNYHMLKQGISIDTTDLSTLVESLKKAEQEIQTVLFGRSDRTEDAGGISLLNETLEKVRAIPGMPVSILGELLKEHGAAFSENVTINNVYETGAARQNLYAAAEEKYETLMTAPRADYGDSMAKAFRNVDDMLREMDLEITESSRRAVRILGYNSMEITEGNIQAVKEAYAAVSRVVNKMTPAATLELIREGSNPLTMTMEELESRLADREGSPEEEAEKYSRYLYHLEQKKEITPEEKESYIGIYRMLHQIGKRDGAVIGSLLQQGAEINFKNLLTAVRSHNRGRMDYMVDDAFGTLEEMSGGYDHSITEAVETAYHTEQQGTADQSDRVGYYRKLASDITEGLTPEDASEILNDDGLSLEAFYDKQRNNEKSEEWEQAEAEFLKEQAAAVRAAGEVSEEAVSMLMFYEMPLTLDYMLAADSLLNDRGGMARQVKKQAEYLDERMAEPETGDLSALQENNTAEEPMDPMGRLLEDAVTDMQEHFTDSVSAQEAYGRMADRMEEILSLSAEVSTDRIDLREINLAWKQISVARNLAREESYEIPMEIGGSMTSVNVRFLHGGGKENHVTITMETEIFGKVSALFEGDKMSGYVISDRQDGLTALKDREGIFLERMQEKGLPVSEIKFIYSEHADINNFAGKADENNSTGMSSAKLYETAKTFMKTFF